MGEQFQVCCWSWVPRSANRAADWLVSFKNAEMSVSTWVSRPPSSLVHVLNKDGLALSTLSLKINLGFIEISPRWHRWCLPIFWKPRQKMHRVSISRIQFKFDKYKGFHGSKADLIHNSSESSSRHCRNNSGESPKVIQRLAPRKLGRFKHAEHETLTRGLMRTHSSSGDFKINEFLARGPHRKLGEEHMDYRSSESRIRVRNL
ncbi:hypothetical protein DVH24_000749 [Malus domestica]|uniref:RNase H type-1 domain-containing protein n=1 Tax=Malus domestica TaxID=3750 RepID=A0A498K3J1_MALDO|nr:hypothetical protein DVH24_000749 [Malus domestica]